MRFDIITIFPEMFTTMDYGVIGRARKNKSVDLSFWNPRDFTEDFRRRVDDEAYGGGPGMVMMVDPLQKAITAARDSSSKEAQLIYLTPQGQVFDHCLAVDLSNKKEIILVSGRYEGIDERLMELEPGLEISIGDYVLSGGELPAMVVMDAVIRQIPGVLGDIKSVVQDSFYEGLLDYPHYTRPDTVLGKRVPEVLLSGNHKEIELFRRKQALGRTWIKRPELLAKIELTATDIMLLNAFLAEQEWVDK